MKRSRRPSGLDPPGLVEGPFRRMSDDAGREPLAVASETKRAAQFVTRRSSDSSAASSAVFGLPGASPRIIDSHSERLTEPAGGWNSLGVAGKNPLRPSPQR